MHQVLPGFHCALGQTPSECYATQNATALRMRENKQTHFNLIRKVIALIRNAVCEQRQFLKKGKQTNKRCGLSDMKGAVNATCFLIDEVQKN
jgi:hypothetical protein